MPDLGKDLPNGIEKTRMKSSFRSSNPQQRKSHNVFVKVLVLLSLGELIEKLSLHHNNYVQLEILSLIDSSF
jgi:hypothetical protein